MPAPVCGDAPPNDVLMRNNSNAAVSSSGMYTGDAGAFPPRGPCRRARIHLPHHHQMQQDVQAAREGQKRAWGGMGKRGEDADDSR